MESRSFLQALCARTQKPAQDCLLNIQVFPLSVSPLATERVSLQHLWSPVLELYILGPGADRRGRVSSALAVILW